MDETAAVVSSIRLDTNHQKVRPMPTRDQIIETLRAMLPELHQRFGVERLALFGSVARDEAAPASDVDILVELATPLGLAFIELALELEEQLGRRVDLATFDSVSEALTSPRRQHIALGIQEDLTHVS